MEDLISLDPDAIYCRQLTVSSAWQNGLNLGAQYGVSLARWSMPPGSAYANCKSNGTGIPAWTYHFVSNESKPLYQAHDLRVLGDDGLNRLGCRNLLELQRGAWRKVDDSAPDSLQEIQDMSILANHSAFMTPHDDLGNPFDFTKNCRIVNKAAKKKWKQVEAAIRLEQLKLTAGLAMVC